MKAKEQMDQAKKVDEAAKTVKNAKEPLEHVSHSRCS